MTAIFARGVSASALLLALTSGAIAQQNLPTIEVGGAARSHTGPARAGNGSGAPRAAASTVNPPAQPAVERGAPSDPATYHLPNTTFATKTNTPIMQTPVSVQVVPKQVLQDQQAVVIDDAIKNVSNVFSVPYVGTQGGWNIRGFLEYAYYLDGVRVNPYSILAPRDTVDVQQIEVVKGPSSILYGRIQPGGLVEVTTKTPQAEPHYEVQQLIGSWNRYRTTLSATGPVTQDKSLLYRMDMSYENANSFRDGLYNYHVFVAPKILWKPTEDTSATFYMQFYNGRDPVDTGIPGFLGMVAPVPRSRVFGSSDANLRTKSEFRLGYKLTHDFDSNWRITNRFDINIRDMPNSWVDVGNPDPANCTVLSCPLYRDVFNFFIKEQDYFTSVDLNGRFDTFGLGHTLLVGADAYRTANYYINYPGNFSTVPPSDLFNPGYPAPLAQYNLFPDFIGNDTITQSWYGVYLQDQITLPYNFHLLAGFRYDSARNTNTSRAIYPEFSASYTSETADAVKPRVGLLWQPIPQLSLYGNYVEGFGFANGLSASRTPLPPESARQYEAGAKVALLDDRLTATFAYFDIVKNNIRSPLAAGGAGAFGLSEVTGAVRNRGVEFDVQGQVTPELKIIGSYAHIDSKILSAIDRGGLVGNRWYGVPKNSGSLWAVYEPQFDPVRGLALGAGFVARGSVEVDRANSFTLPSYAVVDLMARYTLDYWNKKVSFQFNVGNLLDRTYYFTSGTNGAFGGFIPGAPRNFKGAIKVEF